MKYIALVLSLGILFLLTGCQTKSRPAGLPTLHPASVTVTQEDKPLAEALCVLYSETDTKWLVSGLTDAKGVANLVTHGEFSGAPTGKFKVCVSKFYTEPMDPEPTEMEAWKVWAANLEKNPPKQFLLVEDVYGDVNKTPLAVEIEEKGKNQFTLDVGKAIRKHVK